MLLPLLFITWLGGKGGILPVPQFPLLHSDFAAWDGEGAEVEEGKGESSAALAAGRR